MGDKRFLTKIESADLLEEALQHDLGL
jgi:hypothetical protein